MEPIVGLITVGVVAGVAFFGRKRKQKLLAAWQQAAQDLEGEFIPESGPWYKRAVMNIQANLQVPILIDHYTVSTGKSSTTFTRLRAKSTGPGPLFINIYQEGFFSSLGKAFGTQDVNLGDPPFDDKFIVKANDEALCRAWVNQESRDSILNASVYSYTLKNGEVTAIKIGVEDDAQRLVAAARGATAFAAGGKVLWSRLQVLAQAIEGSLTGATEAFLPEQTSLEWQHRGFAISLGFRPGSAGGLFRRSTEITTYIKIRHLGRGEPFILYQGATLPEAEQIPEVSIPDRDFEVEWTLRTHSPEVAARFGQEVTDLLRRVPLLSMEGDENFVTVWFSGVVIEKEISEIMSKALVKLATMPEADPYR